MVTQLFLAILILQAPPPQDITDEELTSLARRIERDHAEGRDAAFDDLLDVDRMVEEGSAGLGLTAREKRDFLAGYRESSLGKAISAALGNTYQFLRIRKVDGRRVLTFRLLGEGLNYHDLEIRRTPAGIRIVDLFIGINGEWISAHVRRILVSVAATDPKRRERLPEWAAEVARHLPQLQEFMREAQTGAPVKALAIFDGFPESMKKDRMIQTIRIMAAARAPDADLLRATDEYTRLFPGDTACDIVSIDALIVRKEYAKCLEAVDRIDKGVGGDPALDIVRGRVRFMQDKIEPARSLALQAVRSCPALQEPHLLLIEISLKERKFKETVERMKALETALKVEFSPENIEAEDIYAEFIKSPEYREWKKSRAVK